jgi:quinol monooxygenase YgiN
MLIIAGDITVAAAIRAEMLDAMAPLMASTRLEDGCIAYVMAADPVAPDRVIVLEVWRSTTDLLAHMATETFAATNTLTSRFKPRGARLVKYRVDRSAPLFDSDGRASFHFDGTEPT